MKSRIAPLAVALIAVLLTAACNQQQSNQEPATPTPVPTPIVPTKPTYKVQKGDVIRQVQFTGRIGPVKEVELFFKVPGRVRNVNTQQSANVKKGDVLADLEIQPLERQVAQAELDLQRVQVNLDRAQKAADSAISRAQLELSMRQLDYDRLKTQDLTPQRQQAEAALESARIAVERAQSAYDNSPLQGRGASGEALNLQSATLNFQSAKAAYDLVIAQITGGHNFDLAMAAKQVALAANGLDAAKQGVDPLLVNDVQRADLSLKTLKAQVTDAEVIAPFDGQVGAVRVSPGSPVEAWASVIVVADPNALEVNGDVNSTIMTDLKETMPVTIALVSVPDNALTGRIRQLPYPYGSGGATNTNDTANVQKDTSTRVSIDPQSLKDVKLVLGDLARVTVILEKKGNVLWLPPQAVRTFEGRKFVVVQEGEGQRRVDVKIGIESEDRVEIQDGVTEGQVAVAP